MVTIREEQPGDEAGIHQVNALAFGRAAEAELVDALRASGGITLSLVADERGAIVGHVLFSPVRILSAQPDGGEVGAGTGLGPVAVLPNRQKQGIGARLITAGLQRLQAQGARLFIVLGHPEYYPRFGFAPASRYGLHFSAGAPDEAFMALVVGAETAVAPGVVHYRAEFDGV